MAVTVETLVARLVGDVNSFVADFRRASGVTQELQQSFTGAENAAQLAESGITRTGKSALGASRGLNIIRNGLSSLAIQATGVPGPLGKISQGLLLLGGGSTLVLGVAAGIGAIALAIRGLTKDARDNARETKEMTDALDAMGRHARMTSIRTKIGQLEQKRDDPGFLRTLGRNLLGFGLRAGAQNETVRAIEAINAEIAILQNEFNQLSAEPFGAEMGKASLALEEARLAMKLFNEPATVLEAALDRLRLKYVDLTEAQRKQIAEMLNSARVTQTTADAYKQVFTALTEAQIAAQGGGPLARQERIDRFRFHQQGIDPAEATKLAALRRKTQMLLNEIQMGDQIRELGASFGTQLVIGLIEGMDNAADMLKSFIRSFVEIVIGFGFRRLLGIASPSKVAMGWGRNIAEGLAMGMRGGSPLVAGAAGALAGSAHFSMDVTGRLPAPMSPFDAARDQQWQRLFKETSLVARQGGFR